MANTITYKDTIFQVGDSVAINYRIKDGDKERQQLFSGILIKTRGDANHKMITVRKISHSGIGVERIIPLNSPYIESIKLEKKTESKRSKLYFIRNLSGQELRMKLYHKKAQTVHASKKKTAPKKTAKKK